MCIYSHESRQKDSLCSRQAFVTKVHHEVESCSCPSHDSCHITSPLYRPQHLNICSLVMHVISSYNHKRKQRTYVSQTKIYSHDTTMYTSWPVP